MKIKCCGMMGKEDILAALDAGPDYLGVILAEGRRRTVSPEEAKTFHDLLADRIPLVGVFVDQDPEEICRLLQEGVIDIAQLHGKERPDQIRFLQEKTGKPVWKAFRMSQGADWDDINRSPADLILLDSGTGSGRTFDWDFTKKVHRDFLLAGGLEAGNLKSAMEEVQPYGVDLSTGLETEGRKDPRKMKEAVELVREADRK